jgi:hypothetical protein
MANIGQPLQLSKIFLVAIVAHAIWCFFSFAAKPINLYGNLGPGEEIIFYKIASALIQITFVILCEKYLSGQRISLVIKNLGIKKPDVRRTYIGLIALVPLIICYVIIFFILNVTPRTVPLVFYKATEHIINRGVGLGMLYLGFIYRHLRSKRNFMRSAFMTWLILMTCWFVNAIQIALMLTINMVIPPIEKAKLLAMIISDFMNTCLVGIFVIPACYLFEKDSNAIWSVLIISFGISASNLFPQISNSDQNNLIIMIGALITFCLTIILEKVIPQKQLDAPKG